MLKNDTVSKDASSYMAILHGRGAMPRVGLNPAKRSTQGHPHKTSKNPFADSVIAYHTDFKDDFCVNMPMVVANDPLGDLVEVNVELLSQLGPRLLTLDGSQSHLRLECQCVVPVLC